jgi:[ribosomal protein S18]-alanine N-acetyltransferase
MANVHPKKPTPKRAAVLAPVLTPVQGATRRAMLHSDLDAVLALEVQCYGHPWSRGNFADSLASAYCAQVLEQAPEPNAAVMRLTPPPLLGYFVAMAGVDEWHLLNISIAPRWQGQGLGTALLAAVAQEGRARGLQRWLLEVRASNSRAHALYTRYGFAEDGVRRAYYPGVGRREDAVLMSRSLAPQTPSNPEAPRHALG